MKLTYHSKLRLSQRTNVNRKNQKEFFRNALRKGKSWNELKEGKLKKYLQSKENHNCKVKVYRDYIFVYSKNNKILYTVYEVPDKVLEIKNKKTNIDKPVYMYNLDGKLIKKFESTNECAIYFNKNQEYIKYNLRKYDKIRKDKKWYRIRRLPL